MERNRHTNLGLIILGMFAIFVVLITAPMKHPQGYQGQQQEYQEPGQQGCNEQDVMNILFEVHAAEQRFREENGIHFPRNPEDTVVFYSGKDLLFGDTHFQVPLDCPYRFYISSSDNGGKFHTWAVGDGKVLNLRDFELRPHFKA